MCVELFAGMHSFVLNFMFRLQGGLTQDEVWLYPMQFHSIILSLFSSLIAPFGGFFASGFKRAFKVKVSNYWSAPDHYPLYSELALENWYMYAYWDTDAKNENFSQEESQSLIVKITWQSLLDA